MLPWYLPVSSDDAQQVYPDALSLADVIKAVGDIGSNILPWVVLVIGLLLVGVMVRKALYYDKW